MKIALIRQRYTPYGGAETYVRELARRIVERGHEVHMLAREWPADESGEIIFHRIPSRGGPSFIKLKAFAQAVAREIDGADFDLVHSFERTYSQDVFRAGDGCHKEWLQRRARAKGRVREITDRINPKHRAFLDVERRLFSDSRLRLVLAISRQGKDEIVRHYGVPGDRVRVLYNGVDRERFHPGLRADHRESVRRELGIDREEPAALFVGTGFERKGLGEAIRSLPHCDLKLIVAGKDRPAPYETLARHLGVERKVVFTGPRPDVERLYGGADVFVLPSWYEPFGNVFLEALASGLPIVTTNEVGGAEAVEEGVNGYTVSFPVPPEELAEKLALALKIDRGTMLDERERLLAPFDWEKNLSQTLSAYDEVLAGF